MFLQHVINYPGKLKIGKSKSHPIIRADQLSKNTGSLSKFILEWSKEVPEMDIAEKCLHFIFREFHYQKEFFRINVEDAIDNAELTLNSIFELD